MDTIDPSLLIAITSLISGIGAIVTAIYTSRTAAHRSDVEALTDTIQALQAENARQNERIEYLQLEIEERDGSLAQVKAWAELMVQKLVANCLEVPAMPDREKTRPRKTAR